MTYFVYILRTSANTLYIGQTNNLEKRIKEHRAKTSKSSKYVRSFSSFKLVYSETYASRKEAMQRERQLKTWKRSRKDSLIQGDKPRKSKTLKESDILNEQSE
jgi:putative endonuclease